MSSPEQLPLNEVKNRLSEVVERVESEHARVTITKHGRPAAVVISTEDLTALEETLLVLSDPEAMDLIRASREQTVAAQVLSYEQATRLVGQPE